ncbi:hypothetical protein P2H44_25260 [Albimonas sp. CAU 1670]|uniref:hypothetical protein n=1 Tax=Albimonas sp. CAU 1670 TaxID=3032599 RepID=UPI0023DB03B4|nr:hypothetical protein [Albimonas sp. CAU 1670]MDF2235875.1 hypothetical protein [Albimonas sp. CAU 1670]
MIRPALVALMALAAACSGLAAGQAEEPERPGGAATESAPESVEGGAPMPEELRAAIAQLDAVVATFDAKLAEIEAAAAASNDPKERAALQDAANRLSDRLYSLETARERAQEAIDALERASSEEGS